MKPDELYNEIVKVTTPEQRGNWNSDLQCKVTKETQELVEKYDFRSAVTVFISTIDGTLWYEIPFAYTPWWKERVGHA